VFTSYLALRINDNVVYIGQAGVRKNGEGLLYRLIERKRNPDKDYWTEGVSLKEIENNEEN
jgi:hypothetical protein